MGVRKGRASRTAAGVATGIVFLDVEPRHAGVLPPDVGRSTRRLLDACGGRYRWINRQLERPFVRLLLRGHENFWLPGASRHLGLRKRYMDDAVRAGLAAGARRVVLVGAGFDSLCLRYAEKNPEVEFVEIDHPATQEGKRVGLEAVGVPPNLTLIANDFGESTLEEVLRREGRCDATAKSVFVVEAVLMYLEEKGVRALFAALAACSAPGSTVAFTYMETDGDGKPCFEGKERFFSTKLKLSGEPLLWGTPAGKLAGMLAEHRWRLTDNPSRDELVERYREVLPPGKAGLRFERFATAVLEE